MRAGAAFLEPVTATTAIDRPPAVRMRPSRGLVVWGAVLALVVVALIGVARPGSGGSVRSVAPVRLSARHGFGSLPLAARAPVAAALGLGDRAYWFTGSSARNPAQGLRLAFSARWRSVTQEPKNAKKLPKFNVIGYGYDNFCLYGGFGIRVSYPSTKLLHTLAAKEQKRIKGTIEIALTANPFYNLDDVKPGTRLTAALTRKLKLGKTFHIGLNDWYIAPGKKADGLLKVRKKIIDEVGITDKQLTQGRKAQQRLLSGLGAD
jgi:hypothetical protein